MFGPGDWIVLLVVAVIAGLCARSLWSSHKNGGGCTGNCATCGGCAKCHTASQPKP